MRPAFHAARFIASTRSSPIRRCGISALRAQSTRPNRGPQELVGQAVELSRTPWQLRTATPEKGEHTDAVLTALGYEPAAIAQLRDRGVI